MDWGQVLGKGGGGELRPSPPPPPPPSVSSLAYLAQLSEVKARVHVFSCSVTSLLAASAFTFDQEGRRAAPPAPQATPGGHMLAVSFHGAEEQGAEEQGPPQLCRCLLPFA